MLRAASGQLGTATAGPVPPTMMNLPRLNAIASSNGSLASNCPFGGSARLVESVMTVKAAGPPLGRLIVIVRLARSQRNWICVPNVAIGPPGADE